MKKIRDYILCILIGILINNYLGFVVLEQYVKSTSIRFLMTSVVTIIFISIFMSNYERKLNECIHNLKIVLNMYAEGNFLAELNKEFSLEDFRDMNDAMDKLKKQMQQWLYNMMHAKVHLKDYAQNIYSNSKLTLDSMNLISDSITETLSDSSVVATDSAENAAISEELLSSNSEVCSYANKFKDFTIESVVKIEKDSKSIDNTLEDVVEIEELMNETSDYIDALGGFLNSISSMTKAISDISEQTNLLSLNASIEAARAGNAGKGFGVVADEIKKLAEQSSKTSTEINNSVELIHKKVNDSIGQIKLCIEKSSEVKSKSGKASKNLNEINYKINQMQKFINDITSNIEQQTSASESLAKNVENVAHFTNKLDKTINDIESKIKEQVKKEKNNMSSLNNIINISNAFNDFTNTFEEKLNNELIKVCEEIANYIEKGMIDNQFLDKLSKEIGISEFYITDSNGVTKYSNNPAGIGFTFKNEPGTQAYDFYRILENPELKVCQEMQVRDIDGEYFKFAGISRTDMKGIIQVGFNLDDLIKYRL